MIIDSLVSAQTYAGLHPLFAQAFTWIAQTDLAALEPGKYPIDGDNLKAIISEKNGMTAEESCAKFECHNKHIDIQVVLNGQEKIGWKPRPSCLEQKGDYNPEKDVLFYNDAPDMFFELSTGQFVIFYPEDVHAPMINVNDEAVRKLVIKVLK